MAELAARIVPRVLPRTSTVLAALVVLLVVAVYGRGFAYHAEALPGTRVAGTDVAGLDRADLIAAAQAALLPKLDRPVALRAGEATIHVVPRELYALDAVATAEAALEAGRRTEPARLAAVVGAREVDVAPVLVDRPKAQRALVDAVSRAGGVPARSARVALSGLEPVVSPARVGKKLASAALLREVRVAALSGRNVVAAQFVPARPRRTTAAATQAAALARVLVSAPVYTFFEDRPLRELTPDELASLVRFRPRGDRFVVSFDRAGVDRTLAPLLANDARAPVDARFEIIGDRVRVVPAHDGVGLDSDAALAQITAAAYSDDRRVADLQLGPVPPKVTTEALAALGITRRISSFTTEMGESSFNRIWNVHLMADYIDGTIIKPGATFSFNGIVGPRTVERGFREGQMIVGSLLLPSIGGGVCQTATTLFNNAFDLGLPIVERHNHSFYISHYPLGRDATVSWGGPDLVFRNDMQNALLIKASYTDATLTFTFYGSSEGRRVVSRTGPQVNWRAPAPSYAFDPYAPAGSVRTVSGSNQSGFDVTVHRAVYARDGKLLRKDAFPSKYIAVGPTTVYGPGTTPPGPYFVLPPPE